MYYHEMGLNNYNSIVNYYFSCMEGFKKFESKPREYGTGDLLYPSEIHTLQMIARESSYNLTQLAAEMKISKSGISKFISKLLEKGFISKNRNVRKGKEVFFTLTEKGRIAYQVHEDFDKKIFSNIYDLLDSCSYDQIEFLEHFLSEMSIRMNDLNKSKS